MVNIPRWQIILAGLVCVLGLYASLPNFFAQKDIPTWIPERQIQLGLDLQGGSHLLLQVEVDYYIKDKVDGFTDELRRTLRKEKIKTSRLKKEDFGFSFRLRNTEDEENLRKVLQEQTRDYDILIDSQGNISATLKPESKDAMSQSALEQSIEIVRRRIDETGTKEPIIQRQGKDRIVVQLPGIDDPDRVKQLLGQTAKLTFHLTAEPKDLETFTRTQREPLGTISAKSIEGNQTYLLKKRVSLGGESLIDAQPQFQDGKYVVQFRLDNQGARKFGRITQENVQKPLAILLDNEVISAPVIQQPILGGDGVIMGSFTAKSANDLAILLRAGALPAPLTILEERTVGPSLGQDSIEAGTLACLIGLVAVIITMVLFYGLFGLIANLALVFNIVFIASSLSLFQATLTLPGIAGIILTIGMAVDANVLIFERIREEIKGGKKIIAAVDSGYKRAMTTIIDANLTTLIAALILFSFGSGPIKGFAVTLCVGLLTSMFSAVMLTRIVMVSWLKNKQPKKLPL